MNETQRAILLLKKLIEIPSVSREEKGVADLMEETMASDGFNVQRSGNNVWVVSRDYDENRPTLLLNAHLDTVKPVAS